MANGDNIQIQPRADAAAAPAPAPTASPQAQAAPEQAPAAGPDLPDELLQQPVMQALVAGNPGAVSANIQAAQESEFGKIVSQFGQDMQRAGFGFYRSQDGETGVVFNQLFVPPEDIQSADQSGNLTQIAPPIEVVEQAILGDPTANPVLSAKGTPNAPAISQPSAPTPQAGGGSPSPTPSRVTTQRKKNLTSGSPTSGPRPGAGRVLNEIMKPVV